MALPGRKARATIDTATSGENTIIAAPGAGAHIQIDHLTVLPSGGANTIDFRNGSGAGNSIVEFPFDDNQAWVFDNASGEYPITLSNNTAFIINLGSATQVDGLVLYRVIGESIV